MVKEEPLLVPTSSHEQSLRNLSGASTCSRNMATTNPKNLSGANFDKTIAEHRVVMVDFWATWCGPCKTMTPDLQQLATEVPDDVLIAKVDVDKQRKLSERFGIQSMPTIMTFVDGEHHSTYVGATPLAGLRAILDEAEKPKKKGFLQKMLGG